MNMTEEKAFISCLLNKPELMARVVSKIKSCYLSDEFSRLIYDKMIEMSDFTVPSLVKSLNGKIKFYDIVEVSDFIKVVTKSTIDQYAYIVLEDYKQRAIKELISSHNDIEEISDKISEIKSLSYFDEEVKNESEEFLQSLEARYRGDEDLRNISTGFSNIDNKIKGFRKSELITIGGRPGSGKTTWGMNIAYNMAKSKKRVLFCSLEMSAVELHERLIKSITKINDFYKLQQKDFEKIVEISKRIKEGLPLIIYDKPGMTVEDIICRAKKEKEEKGIDVLFLDHLAILKTVRTFRSRYEEVSYLTGKLKQIAREFDIPVVCLCQLNRGLESREIKAPVMSDIRDSGSCEQDSDLIFFVYRPEYHLKNNEPDNKDSKAYSDWEKAMKEFKGKAKFILSKNRRGYTGSFMFNFDGANYRFYETED